MTLIVGLHADDHLLLAADSGISDRAGALMTVEPKLEYGGPFAWGFSGYEDCGRRFHDWMRAEHQRLASTGTWDAVISRITDFTLRLRLRRLDELPSHGVSVADGVPSNAFAHPIVLGIVGEVPLIVVVTVTGTGVDVAREAKRGAILATGVDAAARGALARLRRRGEWHADQASLEALMELAIDLRPDDALLGPVRVIRVDTDGTSRDVSGIAFRERFPTT